MAPYGIGWTAGWGSAQNVIMDSTAKATNASFVSGATAPNCETSVSGLQRGGYWAFPGAIVKTEAPSHYAYAMGISHGSKRETESEGSNVQNLKALTYNCTGAYSLLETGVQVLVASGWRPDCALHSDVSLDKTMPPQKGESRFFSASHRRPVSRGAKLGRGPGNEKWVGGTGRGMQSSQEGCSYPERCRYLGGTGRGRHWKSSFPRGLRNNCSVDPESTRGSRCSDLGIRDGPGL